MCDHTLWAPLTVVEKLSGRETPSPGDTRASFLEQYNARHRGEDGNIFNNELFTAA